MMSMVQLIYRNSSIDFRLSQSHNNTSARSTQDNTKSSAPLHIVNFTIPLPLNGLEFQSFKFKIMSIDNR